MEKLVLHRNYRLLTKLSPGYPIAEHLRRWHRANIKNTGATTFTVYGGLAWQKIDYQDAILAARPQQVTSGLIGSSLKLFQFDRDHANRQRQFPSGHFAARANTT